MKHLYTLLAFLFVALGAAAINRSAKATVWIDDLSGVDNYYMQRHDYSTVNIYNGLNLVKFDQTVDNPLVLNFSGDGVSPNVYLNGKLIAPEADTAGKYLLTLSDGDIVRAYLGDAPEQHFAIFTIDEHMRDAVTITRDLVQTFDFEETAVELTGTHYDITIDPARFDKVEVHVYDATLLVGQVETLDNGEGEDVEGGEGNLGDDDDPEEDPTMVKPDANGVYQLDITQHIQIVIKDMNAIGVDRVEAATTPAETLYNLQGIRVADTDNLPAGIYISGGKKILKR